MKARVFLLVAFSVLMSQVGVSAAPPATDPIRPVAYTPDASSVFQIALSQSTLPSIPSSVVFTEYTFGSEQIATDYFWNVCSYLEADMASSSLPMANLELREAANPQCGYALTKGTQATTAVLRENRVLTIWAFGPALTSPVGDFLTVFMWSSTPIVEEAILPDPKTVESPWTVDGPKIDITEYAQTAIESRI